MERIGTFRGVPCFTCSHSEFRNGKRFDDQDNIFIIEGRMVKGNRIIGSYDGQSVTEYGAPYDIYYVKRASDMKKTPRAEGRATAVSYTATTGVEVKVKEVDLEALVNQIHFEDYTSIVDEFFKNLKK